MHYNCILNIFYVLLKFIFWTNNNYCCRYNNWLVHPSILFLKFFFTPSILWIHLPLPSKQRCPSKGNSRYVPAIYNVCIDLESIRRTEKIGHHCMWESVLLAGHCLYFLRPEEHLEWWKRSWNLGNNDQLKWN